MRTIKYTSAFKKDYKREKKGQPNYKLFYSYYKSMNLYLKSIVTMLWSVIGWVIGIVISNLILF